MFPGKYGQSGQGKYVVYTQRNLIKSNRNQIVYTMHRLIWNTNGHCPFAVPNQTENMHTRMKISVCYGAASVRIILFLKYLV